MAITTLLDYAKNRRVVAANDLDNAQKALLAAQEEFDKAQKCLQYKTRAFAELDARMADIRKRLAKVATQADGDVLLDELEQAIMDQRLAQAELLHAEERHDTAKRGQAGRQADLATAKADLGEADALLQQAQQDDVRHRKLKDDLQSAPFTSLPGDAGAALTGEQHTKACQRLSDDIPEKLRTRAIERRNLETQLQQKASQDSADKAGQLDILLDSVGGADRAVDKARAVLSKAENAAMDYVRTGKPRFDKALALLAAIADTSLNPLSQAQKDRIQDPDMKAGREAAADAEKNNAPDVWNKEEKERDDAVAALSASQEDLKAKQAKLDAKEVLWKDKDSYNQVKQADLKAKQDILKDRQDTLQARKVDLQTAIENSTVVPPEKDPVVIAAQSAVDKAQAEVDMTQKEVDAAQQSADDAQMAADTAKNERDKAKQDTDDAAKAVDMAKKDLQAKEKNFKQSNKFVLHSWEAAIPDTAWLRFEDFLEAEAILNGLKSAKPLELASQLGDAEQAYVLALDNADTKAHALRQVKAEAQDLQGRLDYLVGAGASRLLSALRGDE